MRRLIQATVVLSFLALSGCVFSALEKQVEDALGTLDDAALATADEAATIVTQDWKGAEGSAEINLQDGVLTVVSEGRLEKSDKSTVSTSTFEFSRIDEDGYARFDLIEGRMCVDGSKNCNRERSGSATARFIKSDRSDRAVLIFVQLNTIGDNSPIPFVQNTYYSGTAEFIVWSGLER